MKKISSISKYAFIIYFNNIYLSPIEFEDSMFILKICMLIILNVYLLSFLNVELEADIVIEDNDLDDGVIENNKNIKSISNNKNIKNITGNS